MEVGAIVGAESKKVAADFRRLNTFCRKSEDMSFVKTQSRKSHRTFSQVHDGSKVAGKISDTDSEVCEVPMPDCFKEAEVRYR